MSPGGQFLFARGGQCLGGQCWGGHRTKFFFTVSVLVSAAAAGASPASTGVSAVTALITVVVVVVFFSATTAVIGVKVGFGPLGAGVLKPR